MPAKVRIRCKYTDCQFLDDLFCGKPDEVEMDQKKGCLAYLPVKDETPEEDLVEDDELSGEEEEWMELEDEEDEEDAHNEAGFHDYEE